MIPDFTSEGVLPPGLHLATLAEIAARFGHESEIRRVQMESVVWAVDLAVRAGATRVVLNGSFTTDTLEPNDVDCVILFEPGGARDAAAFQALRKGLPFLHLAIARQHGFDELVQEVFASDRLGQRKGMVEVVL